MLDKYWSGTAQRLSPEAPVPVVNIFSTENRVGGAGNVALNIKSLNAQVLLMSAIGEDESGSCLQSLMSEQQVATHWFTHADYTTTTKLRVLAQQQLIRLDSEKKIAPIDQLVLDTIESQLSEYDILILSDYAKGMIKDPQALIKCAKQAGLKILVDPKSTDFSTYRGASILTPNIQEFIAAAGPCPNEQVLSSRAHQIISDCDLEALLVTRGAQGMSLFTKEQADEHIPALAKEVFDITGAGDTVIATLGAALGTGLTYAESALIATHAASIVVGKLGTATAQYHELSASLTLEETLTYPKIKRIMNEEHLKHAIIQSQTKGERVVMTNGCFDLLHAGHVRYLKAAKALGHRLIVAVNDDASVQRLKGESRPLNTLEHRLEILSALDCVDWVISFSEDTPERLIKLFSPDVLVKGGDYQIKDIAGSSHVLSYQGEVKVLEFVEGLSTTSTIKKMQSLVE